MKKWLRFEVCLCALFSIGVGVTAQAHPGGLNTPSPDIPPIIVPGVYLSPSDVHAKYSAGALTIVLQNVEHQPFADLDPDLFACGDPVGGGRCGEHHHFDTDLKADVSVNGNPIGQIEMQGDVRTVAYGKDPNNPATTTGTFDTEMLQMNLQGGVSPIFPFGPIMIRESPSRPSLGKTSIIPLGPGGSGPYHIDSFFDVFTELSLDGGTTWIPKAGVHGTPVHLGGVPEPSSIMLAGLALLGLTGAARRRK